jgi:2-oxoisovalerate dehydrogenase E1 component
MAFVRNRLHVLKNTLRRKGDSAEDIDSLHEEIDALVDQVVTEALTFARPSVTSLPSTPYAPRKSNIKTAPFSAKGLRNQSAATAALDYILEHNPDSFICGQDIGVYGSAFKTCKGLINMFGPERVIDMPICESATVGFCLGASQIGRKPIMEFQFADFSTDALTQLGLNCATWLYGGLTERITTAFQTSRVVEELPSGRFNSGRIYGALDEISRLESFFIPVNTTGCIFERPSIAGFI